MAKVLDVASGKVVEIPDADVSDAVASGRASLPKGDVHVVLPTGAVGTVPEEEAANAFRSGARYRPAAEVKEEARRETYEDREGAAFAAGAARGATLGLSDLALTATGLAKGETLAGLQEFNEGASVGGEVVGNIAGAAIGGAPANLVARAGEAVAVRAGESIIAREAARGVTEGVLGGLGQLVTQGSIQDDPLTSQKVVATLAEGALFGLGTGAVLGGAQVVGGKVLNKVLGRGGDDAGRALTEGVETTEGVGPRAGVEEPVVGGAADGGGAGGGKPPDGAPPAPGEVPPPGGGGGAPKDGGGGGGDPVTSILEGGLGVAKPLKEAVERTLEENPGVVSRALESIDIYLPGSDDWVLRGLDAKTKQLKLLEQKGLSKSAPRALREDARFAQVKNGEDAAQLIEVKYGEEGQKVQAAAAKLDELISPADHIDLGDFAARAEKDLIKPLERGTVDQRRTARRLKQELRALLTSTEEGVAPVAVAPAITPRKAGTYEVPLSELDDLATDINGFRDKTARVRERYAATSGTRASDFEPIEVYTDVRDPGNARRYLHDGNSRLAVARERGEKTIKVTYKDADSAAVHSARPESESIHEHARAPASSRPEPTPLPTTQRKTISFAEAEDWKRQLDASLKWDSATSNVTRDELRKFRGLLSKVDEETAERVAKKVGSKAFGEWKAAKQEFAKFAELKEIADARIGIAKGANRLFSLTDNLAGGAALAAGGGLNPAGLALGLGAALLNKWGRENLPFVMARAMARYEESGGAQQAARALTNRFKGGGGAAGAAAAAPTPPGPGPASPAAVKSAVEGAMASMLGRAADQGPLEAWVAHTVLSGATEYREWAQRQGFAHFDARADNEAEQRAHTVSLAQRQAAAFDRKAEQATRGILAGRRAPPSGGGLGGASRSAAQVLAAAKDPDSVVRQLSARLAQVGAQAPGLAQGMQAVAQRAHQYLAQAAPQPPQSPLGDIKALRQPWKPSEVELQRFAAKLRAVEDPSSVLKDAASGRLTSEAVEALGAVYPELLADLRARVVAAVSTHPRALDYQQRVSIGQLLGVPLDASMQPQTIAALQAVLTAPPQGPARRPGPSGPQAAKRVASEFSPSDAVAQRGAS